MNPVFADAFYFLALLNEQDRVHDKAMQWSREAPNPVITTWPVLIEVADAFAGRRDRGEFLALYSILRSAADVTIIPPSAELFDQGLELYSQRPDKDWSLTDCISFVVMRQQGLTEALTGDRHFEQAGFTVLLK